MKCKDCNYNCARRGEGETECFYEIEMRNQKEAEEASYWQSFRAEAAKDILCAVLPSIPIIDGDFNKSLSNAISNSIDTADELIKQLKEKEEKCI